MPLHLSTSTCRFPCIFRHVAEPAVAAVLSLSKCQQLQWACAAGEQQNPPVTTSPDRLDAPILADNNFARRDFQIEGTRGLHGDTCTADECCLARFQTGAGNKTPFHKALRTALPFPRFENVPINDTRKFAGGPKCPHFYNSRAGQMATESVPPHIFYKMRPQQSSFCGLSTRLPWPSMTSDLAPATPIPLLCATLHNARAAFCRKDNRPHQLIAPDIQRTELWMSGLRLIGGRYTVQTVFGKLR